MNLSMTIIRAVAKELDHDAVYDRAQALGQQAVGLRRAQISGLESIANSTRKVSDVLDYLKLRTARHKEWRAGNIGAAVLGFLQNDLRQRRDGVFKELADILAFAYIRNRFVKFPHWRVKTGYLEGNLPHLVMD